MQHMNITGQRDSARTMWCHHTFSCKSYTFEPLRSWTWFQTVLSTAWDDIVLTGLLIEKVFTHHFSNSSVVEKIPWNLFDVFVNVFCLKSKTFIVPLSVELPRRIGLCAVVPPEAHSGPDGLPGKKAPEAKRRCTMRHAKATAQLRSFCFQKVPRWTPRTSLARASIREAGARHRGLPDLGTSEGFSGIETSAFFSKCLAKLCLSTPKSAGIDDHNVICQYVWKTD